MLRNHFHYVEDEYPFGTGSRSAIMPAIHPHCSGSIGIGHGKDYYVADKKLGCLYPAQCLVLTAAMLLSDNAAKAKQVIAESKPYFKSKEEYLAAIDGHCVKVDRCLPDIRIDDSP